MRSRFLLIDMFRPIASSRKIQIWQNYLYGDRILAEAIKKGAIAPRKTIIRKL
ncbi:hypothetical protein NDI49_00015 [Trichocoleus sp. ST-U3]|uniref:hypothetical protein n=1 Tax=Coleofasciculus sp. FACHB-542 TaxID=2692787 RepID=UPI001688EFBB|nr:hypothetical protein [Coleofasciculus sp. FACHB-542]MBD2084912.1 hypothetical protein [Coleofasciculus sp. FACHB-542]